MLLPIIGFRAPHTHDELQIATGELQSATNCRERFGSEERKRFYSSPGANLGLSNEQKRKRARRACETNRNLRIASARVGHGTT
jgi:hypothetical protein